jgi:hypothetical protein
LSIGQGEDFNLNSLTLYSKAANESLFRAQEGDDMVRLHHAH